MLLREQVDKVLGAERAYYFKVIIEKFVQNPIVCTNVEKYDHILITPTSLSVRVPWRAGRVTANRANFLEVTIGFIEAVLSLHNKCIIVDHMPMENDLLARSEFKKHINGFILLINT